MNDAGTWTINKDAMEGMHETTLLRLLERIWECEGVREQALDVFVPRFLVEPSKGVSSCHV